MEQFNVWLLTLTYFCLATFAASTYGELPTDLGRWLGPQEWIKDGDGAVLSLDAPGEFDDMHIFAPTVAEEQGTYKMWYCGSRGTRTSRVFRLGLATGKDGIQFESSTDNPVLAFADGERSVLTPGLLHHGNGNVLRENGRLRIWFSSTIFGKTGLHTLHESTSADGVHWDEPSPALLEHVYCPTVLKSETGYQLWYVDVRQRPWVVRYAESTDGRGWLVRELPVLQLSQPWEAEIVVYPCVLKVDGTYLMWYGSYNHVVRRQTTAIGFAVSNDGVRWHKHPANPVLRPDPIRPWEANYVTSGSVMQLDDGGFRFWYASRKAPPFENLYFAINSAHWAGPKPVDEGRLPLPPKVGDAGTLSSDDASAAATTGRVETLEIVDDDEMIVRAWYVPRIGEETTFVDLWVRGVSTGDLKPGDPVSLPSSFRVTGNQSLETTCGGRSLPLLEAAR